MKYGELNLGQIEAMVNKLDGMEGVRRFLSGDLVVKEAEHNWIMHTVKKIGTGLKKAEDFRRSFIKSGAEFTDWADEVIREFTSEGLVEPHETKVELVIVSVAGLGFKNMVNRCDVYERAREIGLYLCPPEVGPQLVLQWDKMIDKNIPYLIGMEPLKCSDGIPRLFRINPNLTEKGKIWLEGIKEIEGPYGLSVYWVFLGPRFVGMLA